MVEQYTVSSSSSKAFFVAGAFPPPVHGFANAMLSVYSLLNKRGHRVIKLDTSLGAGRGVLVAAGLTAWGALKGATKILFYGRPEDTLYLGITAGMRQIPDALIISSARIVRMKRVIHHHSFAYINKPNTLARLCFSLAGKEAIHIALCKTMSTGLKDHYNLQNKIYIISNAALIKPPRKTRMPKGTDICVGFLGALTREKGIDDFIAVAESIGPSKGVTFAIAGSLTDTSYLSRLNALNSQTDWVRYCGELSGDNKEEFLGSVDVLLFPTKYVNEAEPLVILEALASGVVVVANVRGCIGELDSEGMVLVHNPAQFIDIAQSVIKSLQENHAIIINRSNFARNTFTDMRQQSLEELHNVFLELEQ